MANILSLAVRVTGDASGLQLTPVEKALQRLQAESDKTSAIFEKFAQSSELGAKAQETFNAASDALLQSLRDGNITRDEFVKQFQELEAGARETAAALAEGARVTEANRTAEERYAAELQRLNGLREKGGIDQETYNRAVAAARKPLDDAAAAAERAAQASGNSALKFNELSGVFAVLPGPLGNIAGRISGITSASEGLTRIFSGGLQSGLSNVVGSFTALATPVNVALAGVTAFAAGAKTLADRLVALEDRVEKLGRLSDQLGVSFEFVQVLEEAGSRTDVSVQQISASFARLQNTLASTDAEGKKASQALGRLGVSLQEFGQLSQQQQIELIGEKLASIEDPAQRSAAAIALFGRSGVQLLPFFNELDLAASDMERFGRAITDVDRQRLADLGGGLDALAVAAKGLGDSLTLPFVGLGEGVARALADAVAGVTAIVDPLGRALQPLLTGLGQALQTIGAIVNVGGRLIGAVVEPVAKLVEFLSPATAAAKATSKALDGVREAAEKPVDVKVYKAIADEAERTTSLLQSSAREIGVAGQEAGVAYLRLIDSVRVARDTIDQTTKDGAEKFRLAVERANDAYQRQIAIIKKANEERANQIKSEQDIVNKLLEQQRIQEQFGGDSQRAQAAEYFKAISSEIERLRSRLQDVVNTSAEEDIRRQIQNLDQLARKQADIASGREQARKAEYEREAARVQQLADERERAEREATDRIARQRQAINEYVNEQLALQQFDGDSQRLQAQRNLLAIQEEIRRVEQDGAAARVRNDEAGVKAAIQRIQQLDQVAAKEEEIASGRAKAEAEIAKQRDAALKAQQAQQAAFAQEQERYYRQVIEQQQRQAIQFQATLQKNFEENNRILANYRELATASTQAAQGADIRTDEGARNFIQALQGGFDPQLAVQRQQLKVQQRIATGLEANLGALGFQTFRFPAAAGA